jgi:endonuclease/exonuclease/phosphatase family metal-dependent hydrolase
MIYLRIDLDRSFHGCARQAPSRSIRNADCHVNRQSPFANQQSIANHKSKIANLLHPRVIALCLAAVFTAACTSHAPALSPPRPQSPVVLVVVTWNVHSGRGDLPRFIDDLTQGRLTGFPVRDYAILLQETIAGNQYDAVKVARDRQAWAYFEQVRESKQGTSGNAIVTTAMPLSARTIVLPRIRRVRKAIVASLEIDRQPLFIVDAHFENRYGWLHGVLISDRARKQQADALLKELPAGPGILGGDLNTWLGTDEPALKALGLRFDAPPNDAQAPTFANRLVLDHLFFDLPSGWTASRRVIADRYGSDHHPVLGLIVAHGPA